MKINLHKIGKRFNREWIFRNLDYTFESGRSYAITGPNGSGKSTLLQTIAGAIMPSEGYAELMLSNNQSAPPEEIYQYISITAPYLELIEEMTATEFLNFHFSFKSLIPDVTIEQVIENVGLKNCCR